MSFTLHTGDNLAHLRSLPDASVDLVATDPPYFTQKEWRGGAGEFSDRWETREAFVESMRERAVEMRRVLKPDGTLYWQCDPNISPWLRFMLNEVFGGECNFVTEIYWKRHEGGHNASVSYGLVTDILLMFGSSRIDKEATARPVNTSTYGRQHCGQDAHGNYMHRSLFKRSLNSKAVPWGGYNPAESGHDWLLPGTLPPWIDVPGYKDMDTTGRLDMLVAHDLFVKRGAKHHPAYKQYHHLSKGTPPTNWWDDIERLAPSDGERVGYPTQKPVALYERIVLASSPPGGVVLDPFCGSGTTGVAALRHGRSFIGMDANPDAIAIAGARLDKERTML